MDNILFCSAGRRGRLLADAKQSLAGNGLVMATDGNATASALFFADKSFVVPKINDPHYIEHILQLCKENNVKAITTLIDPEIEILAKNRNLFLEQGVLPLTPDYESALYCFDKFELYQYLSAHHIPTVLTFHDLDAFRQALADERISFPVFMKPICGSGSVGAHRVNSMDELLKDWNSGEFDYIIQELMTGGDCDADVYVDCISHKVVSAFSKRKIETRIGGASKTISFKDPKLFEAIRRIVDVFSFNGPLDMDFFIRDGEYYLSEINPRFGGAYLHAYGAGVDFFKLIQNNMHGVENKESLGDYDEDILMLMYDDVVITKKQELINTDFSLL